MKATPCCRIVQRSQVLEQLQATRVGNHRGHTNCVNGWLEDAGGLRVGALRGRAQSHRGTRPKRHGPNGAAQIKTLAAVRFPALTRRCGVNALTAGILAGLLGPGQRFANDAQLAAYAGVAPLEASSGEFKRQSPLELGHLLDRADASTPLTRGARLSRAKNVAREDEARGPPCASSLHRPSLVAAMGRVPQSVRLSTDAGGRMMRQRRNEKRTATRRPWPALLTLTERLAARSSLFKHHVHIGASHPGRFAAWSRLLAVTKTRTPFGGRPCF